jgi:hypothetical protein
MLKGRHRHSKVIPLTHFNPSDVSRLCITDRSLYPHFNYSIHTTEAFSMYTQGESGEEKILPR